MELRKSGSLLACVTASCVLAGAARPTVTAPCQLYANDTSSQSCWVWDLSSVPQHTWDVNTSTCPDDCNVFRVASPCSLADNYGCRPGSGSDKPAPAYQESNTDRSCYALGNLDHPMASPLNPVVGADTGLLLVYTDGDAGRRFTYRLLCNDNDQGGPDVGVGIIEHPGLDYTVTWPHKAFCPTKRKGVCPPSSVPPAPMPAPSPSPPPSPPHSLPWGTVPRPTVPQLQYYQSEVRALIHFNMATFIRDGDPGCSASNWNTKAPGTAGPSSDPATFNPDKLDFSNWIESMNAVGIRNAVMTAKHGCGHLLWPTNVTLPGGAEYEFCVGKEKSAIKSNVAADFAKAMTAEGIRIGFYYSLTNNFYMNVLGKVARGSTGWLPGMAQGVNQSEFERIAFAQLTELWTEFGHFSEVWLDGGYPLSMLAEMKDKLPVWQPNATAWNGLGEYESAQDTRLSASPVRWVGTESGLPGKSDIWSTASQAGDYSGAGDPNSPVFAPPGCDTHLQTDGWFWTGAPVRTLSDLQQVYHETVGRNCVIELDFAINRSGLVDPAHAAQYAAFGDWIKCQYGGSPGFNTQFVDATGMTTIAGNASSGGSQSGVLELKISPPTQIDRVMIQEQLEFGQRIRSYTVEVLNSDGQWTLASSGQSVGNKRIDFLSKPAEVSAIRLTVVANQASPVYIHQFAAFKDNGC